MALLKAVGFAAVFAVVSFYYAEKAYHYAKQAIDANQGADSEDH
jgi:hypothetical protein